MGWWHGKKKTSGKKSKSGKKKNKSRAAAVVIPHQEMERESGVYRFAAALRHALSRAGAVVASNAAALIVNRCRVEPFEGGDFLSSTCSAPRLTSSPGETPPPPLTGVENRAATSPPPTDADNSSSTTPRRTGGDTLLAPGSQAGGTAPVPASNCTSSPTDAAKNSGSQAGGSGSAPASNSRDTLLAPGTQASGTAPASNLDSSPPTDAAKNSGSQAGGSGSAPASSSSYTTPRREPKQASASPLKGAKKSGSHASGPRPASAQRPPTAAKNTPSAEEEDDPFSEGYCLNSLFEEDDCFVEEEDALAYARFCSRRASSLLNKKDKEMCHICYFKFGNVKTFWKNKTEPHCQGLHKDGEFLCEKQGCFIRTSSSQDAGRHDYFCHEKYQGWWVDCLKRHGEI